MLEALTTPDIGWHGWPRTTAQLSTLTRGLVDLERAAARPPEIVAVVDLDGVRAVVDLIHNQRGAPCHR